MKKSILFLIIISSQVVLAGTLTASGISSGGFMASQLATIYSDQISGVGTVAGGVFFCAKNHFQEKIAQYGRTGYFAFGVSSKVSLTMTMQPLEMNPIYQAVGVCMESPEDTHGASAGPMDLSFMNEFESQGLIAPARHIAHQRVLIYQGKDDNVLRPPMALKLEEYYRRMGVPNSFLKSVLRPGGHNFPTDREDGIGCYGEGVPYVANCKYDLAGDVLQHTLGRKLVRGVMNPDHLHIVEQMNAPTSIQSYGYLYANNFCLNSPEECDLHVAFHGCKMSDDYDEIFQKAYESKVRVSRILSVQDYELRGRTPQMGARIFASTSGYGEYAELMKNRLMIYFPQTRISTENYPANPKGCWDWYGWTGSEYATNKGKEAQWLIQQIKSVQKNPKALVTKPKETPIFE